MCPVGMRFPVVRTAVLLACPCSFRLSGSRTQKRVRLCCSRALLTDGCSWRHSSSRAWKKCCGPSVLERWTHRDQATVNIPVGLNDSAWHENENTIVCWNHDRMERQFNWPDQESLQLRHYWAEKNWAGGSEVRWVNTSGKELRGEERDEKRVEESQEDVRRNEGRWKELPRGEKSLDELRSGFTICDKRSEVLERAWKSAAAPIGKPSFWIL